MNFGELKAKIEAWMREPVEAAILEDACNDAIQSLFMSALQANLSQFLEGPVQNLVLASGSERGTIVSIQDPAAAPVPGTVAGAPQAGARALVLGYTYVTESGSETLLSPAANQNLDGASLSTVPAPAASGFGWNLYANGIKQNDVPLSFNEAWTEQESGVATEGPKPPAANKTADDICFIRHMEVQTSAGSWRLLPQADIDSALMKILAASKASNSLDQQYAYDFVNQRTVEVRPAAGRDLSPRYFYIRRPRRLRYEEALIPFETFDPEAFLRYYALSLCMLANHEFDASQAWQLKAEGERLSIMKLLGWNNFNKDLTVQPYMR